LVASNEGATNFLGANLRHVQDDNGGLKTDTDTGDETTSNDQTETSRGSLKNDTNDVDTATKDDGPLATNDVGGVTSDESTEEGTGRENGGDQRQVATSE